MASPGEVLRPSVALLSLAWLGFGLGFFHDMSDFFWELLFVVLQRLKEGMHLLLFRWFEAGLLEVSSDSKYP